jgi:cytochrome c oxidase subunit 2
MIDTFRNLLGMPVLSSQNGRAVDELIVYIHWLMIALFVGWLAYFLYCVWRFRASRNAQADHVGARSHASTWIELVVAGVEAVLLVMFAIPMWSRAADVTKFSEADKAQATQIQIMAQQFGWNARYAGKDGEFGKQSMNLIKDGNLFGVDPADPKGKDDVQVYNDIHVPVGKPVICYVGSKDVIHSFKIIAMRVTQDAIPGLRIPTWFKPVTEGRYQINCAQLCGVGHTSMSGGFVTVESQEQYDAWMAKNQAGGGGGESFE